MSLAVQERQNEIVLKGRSQFDYESFYLIGRERLLESTTPPYRKFLKEAKYADIDKAAALIFGKGLLKCDQKVLDHKSNISFGYDINGYVNRINQENARKLVKKLGNYKLLTTGLMYRLVIPYIKDLAQQGNIEAQATLKEMTAISFGKAEWLEDLVLDKTRLKIGTQERTITLPDKDGYFGRTDINEFGYSSSVKDSGEFYHWHVSGDERAAIRYWSAELYLLLNREPSVEFSWLGVRLAKFLF